MMLYFGKFRFNTWCSNAVSGIRFPPDQQTVGRELYQHMEDHYDALLAQGIGEEEAERMTVEAMGDAYAVARDLAAIHRPFWGYFLRATRILLVILLCVTLIPLGRFIYNTDYREPSVWGFDVFDPDAYVENGHTLLRCLEPDCTVRSGGYTFTVSDAAEWTYHYTDSNDIAQTRDVLCLHMSEFNPLPWAEHTGVGGWFWAEDNLGNVYGSAKAHNAASREAYLCASGDQVSLFSYSYTLWINDFDIANAEWIAIHYDRDGRNLTWHIDLTGGAPS